MLVRGVILLIATATATFAQSIAIGDFESLGAKPEAELAGTIRDLLLKQFIAEGFRAELVSVPSSDMPVAQGADLTIVGQYIRTENGLLLYGQIFTERGMIEAYNNGGMYLTNKKFNPHFRAFPENITRAHVNFTPRNWTFGVNYLYYANWYSPVGNRIEGNHILNGNVGYAIGPRMEISLIVKNMLAEGALYPMNSNAGDAAVSDGSPALEGRTYLVQFRYSF